MKKVNCDTHLSWSDLETKYLQDCAFTDFTEAAQSLQVGLIQRKTRDFINISIHL